MCVCVCVCVSEKTEGTLREMFVRKTKQKQNTLYTLVMFSFFPHNNVDAQISRN